MKPTGTYVYCVVAAARRPALKRARGPGPSAVEGLAGAGPVRLIDQGGAGGRLKKWLVVADVPLDRYGESAINSRLSDLEWVSRAAVAHEAVVESFIGAAALVPMKLFTIFTDDERAVEQLNAQNDRIDEAVKHVRGRIELGVRVTLARQRTGAHSTKRAGSGAAYLAVKKAQRDREAELAVNAQAVVAELFDNLSRLAADAVRTAATEIPVRDGPLLLDAAFLVPRPRAARFRSTVARRARTLTRDGYRVTLTGPWPPYSFVKD
jgi:hypothetical protein